jgi:hypothetical protein
MTTATHDVTVTDNEGAPTEALPVSVEERLDIIDHKVQLVLDFCMRLAATLDALGENPMVAAMLPPGTFGE